MPKSPPRRATINAVAELAGVSTATVSRVLTGVSPVNESTRMRVLEAVDQLNYRPSELTRAVFAGRSNTIGLLLADMRNPYYIDLVDGVSRVANPSGAMPYLALGNREPDTERRLLSLMDSHRVRGLIFSGGPHADDLVHAMAEAGTECVYMARNVSLDHPRLHSIRLDDLAAGRLAWEHLSSIGRTRILIVAQGEDTPTRRERVAGMIAAAADSGITVDHNDVFRLDSLTSPSNLLRDRIRERVSEGTVDAIFATTGIATFRAYEALIASGVSVPREVAMLGLDDFAWADYLSPSLSVITQPAIEMGMAATQIILEEPGESRRLTFAPSLTVRASSAP
jgi:LacI family transcriptional regulator